MPTFFPGAPPVNRWVSLAIWLALVFAVAAAGSAVTTPQIPTWYASLAKPPFNPPSWVFGPVWTLLYAMMAVAIWRIARLPPVAAGRRTALWLFLAQLALNGLWSPAFFGLQSPLLGLAVIVPLLAVLAWTVAVFFRLDTLAGLLLVPYLLWVAFATVLNAAIVSLN